MTQKQIEYPINGQSAYLTLCLPQTDDAPETYPVLIVCRGWPSSPQNEWLEMAQRIADASQTAIVLFDYSGMGTNLTGDSDSLTLADHVSEVTTVFDTVSALAETDERRVALYGNSYGAPIVCAVASSRAVQGIRISAPALYPASALSKSVNSFVRSEEKTFVEAVDEGSDNPSIAGLKSFTGPVMILEHERDELIPKAVVNAFVQAAQQADDLEYHIVAEAAHHLSDETWRAQSEQYTVDWLKKINL